MEFSTKKCAGGGREIAFGRMLERELHLGSLLGMFLDGEERERERESNCRGFLQCGNVFLIIINAGSSIVVCSKI
jgi:hypothetical protein